MPQTKEGARKNQWLRFIHGEGRQVYLELLRRREARCAEGGPRPPPPPPEAYWSSLLEPLVAAGWETPATQKSP